MTNSADRESTDQAQDQLIAYMRPSLTMKLLRYLLLLTLFGAGGIVGYRGWIEYQPMEQQQIHFDRFPQLARIPWPEIDWGTGEEPDTDSQIADSQALKKEREEPGQSKKPIQPETEPGPAEEYVIDMRDQRHLDDARADPIPDDPQLRDQLVSSFEVAVSTGAANAARDTYDALARVYPNDPELPELQKTLKALEEGSQKKLLGEMLITSFYESLQKQDPEGCNLALVKLRKDFPNDARIPDLEKHFSMVNVWHKKKLEKRELTKDRFDNLEALTKEGCPPDASVAWEADRPLTWDDFRNPMPSPSDRTGAFISCQITYSFDRNNRFLVFAVMDPNASWKHVNMDNAAGLKHEQTHFDIAEVFARIMRSRLKSHRHSKADKYEVISQVYKEYRDAQERYDQETRHGLDGGLQQQWERSIASDLEKMKVFAWIPHFFREADRGFANAQFYVGQMYHFGEGIPQSYKKAKKYYQMAAINGHASSRYNLGILYLQGKGVKQSDKKAVRWFRSAAKKKHTSASFNMGLLHLAGKGVKQSEEKANQYFWEVVSGRREDRGAVVLMARKLLGDDG